MKNLLLLLTLSIFSCRQAPESITETAVEEQTPEVLIDKSSNYSVYVSESRGMSIIDRLFEEALEKNTDLRNLSEDLEGVHEAQRDSMNVYNKYVSNNDQYWEELNHYAGLLNDSTTKVELNGLIDALREKHNERTSEMQATANDVEQASQRLHDLEILMKIVVTHPMMENYQRNQMPNQTLENLEGILNEAIEQVEPRSQIVK